MARAVDEKVILVGIAGALSFLGCLALQEGNVATAGGLFEESLALLREVNDSWPIIANLQRIGVTLASKGRPVEAAWLWGAAEALCAQLRAPLPPEERAFVARASAAVRAELGEEAFTTASSLMLAPLLIHSTPSMEA